MENNHAINQNKSKNFNIEKQKTLIKICIMRIDDDLYVEFKSLFVDS